MPEPHNDGPYLRHNNFSSQMTPLLTQQPLQQFSREKQASIQSYLEAVTNMTQFFSLLPEPTEQLSRVPKTSIWFMKLSFSISFRGFVQTCILQAMVQLIDCLFLGQMATHRPIRHGQERMETWDIKCGFSSVKKCLWFLP